MVNQKVKITPHPLLQQFTEWAQIELTNDTNYYAINSSLYAAERYIKQRFDVQIFSTNTTDRGRLLSALSSGGVLLPEVKYISNGKVIRKGGAPELTNKQLPLHNNPYVIANYVDGYITKDSIFVQVDEEVASSVPSAPVVTIDGTYSYPYLTNSQSVSITVYGKDQDKIIVNGEDSGEDIIGESKTLTINMDKDIKPYNIALQSYDGTISETRKVLLIKHDGIEPFIILLGHDIVSNDGQAHITIFVNADGTVNGETVTTGVNNLTLTITDNVTQLDFTVGTEVISGTPLVCKYDISLSNDEVLAYNKKYQELLNKMYIPNDLLVAFYKVAFHFFQTAISKEENIGRYSAGMAKSITFSGHSIPKDVIAILSTYVDYSYGM